MRLLASAYRLSSHLGEAETAERDPEQLRRLFHIDHAITQIRRQTENLHVLTGLRVDDAGRQITTLLDVIRAAASAIDQYRRVQIGHVTDLAVAEHAADDVIRVLTELADNATRYSPPSTLVTMSAHLTEHGTVLLRVEDTGVGVEPARLPYLNAMLAGQDEPGLAADDIAQLGLVVVRRLADINGLRVALTPRQPDGTTAIVLLPTHVLCEVPGPRRSAVVAVSPAGAARSSVRPLAAVPARHPAHAATHAAAPPRRTVAELPLRTPESLRAGRPQPTFLTQAPGPSRLADDIGAFADGLADAEHVRATTPHQGIR